MCELAGRESEGLGVRRYDKVIEKLEQLGRPGLPEDRKPGSTSAAPRGNLHGAWSSRLRSRMVTRRDESLQRAPVMARSSFQPNHDRPHSRDGGIFIAWVRKTSGATFIEQHHLLCGPTARPRWCRSNEHDWRLLTKPS